MNDKEELKAFREGRKSYALNGMFPAFIPFELGSPELISFWDGHAYMRTVHLASGLSLNEFRDSKGF